MPNERLVDIHCHLLPGLDDGPDGWDETLAMARMAAEDGITVVVATPHQLGNFAHNRGDAIRQLVHQARELFDRHAIPLDVLPGADVRIEPEMVSRIAAGDVLTLADRRRYVLLELPHEVYLPLEALIGQLRAAGLVGVLSHPERNLGILARPGVVTSLVEAGCLMQVTAGSLTGSFGPEVQKLAERLVVEGLAHFVATDAHGVRSRRPLLRRAFERISQLAGPQTAYQLCCANPACVVADREILAGRQRVTARGRKRWMPWRKAG
ncbi:MAG TPA: hypothetical protein EYP56_06365 [Planctomycetaceae bacterium]|nr:hypothetical protein [Planctomycetaceae bacterium]